MTDLAQNAEDALLAVQEAQRLFEKHEAPLGEDGEHIASLMWAAEVYLRAAIEGNTLALLAAETLRDNPYVRKRGDITH